MSLDVFGRDFITNWNDIWRFNRSVGFEGELLLHEIDSLTIHDSLKLLAREDSKKSRGT